MSAAAARQPDPLPPVFAQWFARRGWALREHQRALIRTAQAARSVLLIAPTGAGKTLAGFLPTLIELQERPTRRNSLTPRGIHTLYISPLKALAVDIARNLETPIREMGLAVRVETRTGDTPPSRRERQKRNPPDILLTTPEQVALMLASDDAQNFFGEVRRIVFDELHSLVPTKRGDLLSLGFARIRALAPGVQAVGLSATVRDPDELRRWLVGQPVRLPPPRPSPTRGEGEEAPTSPLVGEVGPEGREGVTESTLSDLVVAAPTEAAPPIIRILETAQHLPWSGHLAQHAMPEIYAAIQAHRLTLVFVNTRMQAEFVFQMLWAVNDAGLRIALHHGSLDVSQRRRVEDAMGRGAVDAVVCTSTLDLGIDWGDVDLVINIGAPKGASRLLQRIGRANHRLDEPSQALLVPSNRFEVMECRAAVDAAYAGAQDAAIAKTGAIDVLAQHILGMAVSGPFDADDLYAEVASAEPYAGLPRETFDDCLAFVATGGYALKAYERFAKIRQDKDGRWRAANPRMKQAYRMNSGTIIEATMLKVRLGRAGKGKTAGAGFSRTIGEIEEGFAEMLVPGDTFIFGGEILRLETIVEDSVIVSKATGSDPKVPSYAGSKFPLSTHLAARVRDILSSPESWHDLPAQVEEWLTIQKKRSVIPKPGEMLFETFPRGGRFFMVGYPFEGRLAHQTLGMLLTRRLERARLRPTGFVASDYAFSIWGLGDVSARERKEPGFIDALFSQDMLGDDLEAWLDESMMMKRTFRNCAIIAGLIERKYPGLEKRARQVTVSTDLIYDVLRRHEPGHILLRAARADAATGLLDIRRLSEMLSRIRGRIIHKPLERPSPLSVPVLLDIGRETVIGEASDAILGEAAEELIREAMELDEGLEPALGDSGGGHGG